MSEDDLTTDRDGVPPSITELIVSYQARTGDSQHRMSARSKAATGHKVTQRYLSDLALGKAKGWPTKPETYSAMAAALETTPLAVVLGLAVYHGVPVTMPSFASQLPPGVDNLPENQREAVLGLLWSMVSDAPVRRYLPDDATPDYSDLTGEGVVEGSTDQVDSRSHH